MTIQLDEKQQAAFVNLFYFLLPILKELITQIIPGHKTLLTVMYVKVGSCSNIQLMRKQSLKYP